MGVMRGGFEELSLVGGTNLSLRLISKTVLRHRLACPHLHYSKPVIVLMPLNKLKASFIPNNPQLHLYRLPAINPSVEGRDGQAAKFMIGDHWFIGDVERGWYL